jgi:undecaprenyl-diphosphatase
MSYLEAIIFGIVQGITEFLPISSTAHIVITQHLLGIHFPGLSFEILLHQASVLAVIVFFRKDLVQLVVGFFRFLKSRSPEDRVHFFFGLYIVVATGITAVLGYALQRGLSDQMKSPTVIAIALSLTGLFLILIERVRAYGNISEPTMRFHHAIIVGLGQTAAVFPGISRSGATLIAALWCGLNRETAVRYSFLLAIPVILGTSVLALRDVQEGLVDLAGLGPLLVAFAVTFLFSVLGILWLIEFLKKSRLIYFAVYCFLLAIFVFFYFDPQIILEVD